MSLRLKTLCIPRENDKSSSKHDQLILNCEVKGHHSKSPTKVLDHLGAKLHYVLLTFFHGTQQAQVVPLDKPNMHSSLMTTCSGINKVN
jgi:hypothetical protein